MVIKLFTILLIIAVAINSAAKINKTPSSLIESNRQRLNERIVGGETAVRGQFPYQISIRLFGFIHICGGSIISNNWIVSAAQCTFGLPEEYTTIFAGAHHIYNDGIQYEIDQIIIHPDYEDFYLYNDITLLRTLNTIEFNQFIQPISIGDETEIGAGIPSRSSGWGSTMQWGPDPEFLQYLDLVTLTREDCAARHPDWWFLVHHSTICAYSNEHGRGMCNGDMGGPLTANNQLIGIVSWTEQCAIGRPDAFARISIFVPWIKEITGV